MSGFVYGLLWVFCNVFSRIFLRFKTIGGEWIPKKGGILFAANHASYLDIPLLGCGIPRRVSYLGRANLFPHPFFNWSLRCLGWIPLKTGRLDRQAFGEAVSRLKTGKPIVIFPEGTRTSDGCLQAGKPGIGVLVAESNCSVIPAYISGTYEVLPIGVTWLRYHPVTVRFGKPIEFGTLPEGQSKEFYEKVSSTVMARIADLGQVPAPNSSESQSSSF